MLDSQKIWQAVLGELELMLSKVNFTTWFKNTFVVEVSEEKQEVVIGVPNAFTKSWMEQRYNKYILEAINRVSNNQIRTVVYTIQLLKKTHQRVLNAHPVLVESNHGGAVAGVTLQTTSSKHQDFTLNPKYSFNTFIVGSSNQLAHSASLAVSDEPGTRYNPLFLYGDVGLGKTHLMQAIGHAMLTKHTDYKVLYITFERFTNDFVAAVRKGAFEEFRKLYRSVDVLLVDDVQFMIDKEKTQDEFFHTFEVLHQNNKQIVLTSDRPPKALVELQDRMISRFEWGMIADIKMPDKETRIAILEHKCAERGFGLDKEIITYIAENVKHNIRELEGALNKIIALYELNHKDPALSMVREMLSNFTVDPSKKALSPKRILDTVAEFYAIAQEDIVGSCRKKELVMPRQIVMYLMRRELAYSYPTIGDNLGGRDHTTVMYACQKIEGLVSAEDRLHQELETIKQRLYTY